MAMTSCEITWVKHLSDLKVKYNEIVVLYYDNKGALHIATNLIYHERTKHIELDCHIVREKIQEGGLKTEHVKSVEQVADALIKALSAASLRLYVFKMGAKDLYSPSWGRRC